MARSPSTIPSLAKLCIDTMTVEQLCAVHPHAVTLAKIIESRYDTMKLEAARDTAGATTKELEYHRLVRTLPANWRSVVG